MKAVGWLLLSVVLLVGCPSAGTIPVGGVAQEYVGFKEFCARHPEDRMCK